MRRFAQFAFLVALAFAWPLGRWVRLALTHDAQSHILLVPVIAGYLIWMQRAALAETGAAGLPRRSRWHRIGALSAWALAGAALGTCWILAARDRPLPAADALSLQIAGFWGLLAGGACWWLGGFVVAHALFPTLFLIFMVPVPSVVMHALEVFLQHASADAAHGLLRLSGTPVFRDGLFFQLPGFTMQVAQQCSGVRSTLVLFITSLLAGHLFLRSPGRRLIFVLAVIPLGILRNGVRIFTIAMLCVHVSPDMINSPIHHRGGPLFFALSLVPLFGLLWLLRRREKGKAES